MWPQSQLWAGQALLHFWPEQPPPRYRPSEPGAPHTTRWWQQLQPRPRTASSNRTPKHPAASTRISPPSRGAARDAEPARAPATAEPPRAGQRSLQAALRSQREASGQEGPVAAARGQPRGDQGWDSGGTGPSPPPPLTSPAWRRGGHPALTGAVANSASLSLRFTVRPQSGKAGSRWRR